MAQSENPGPTNANRAGAAPATNGRLSERLLEVSAPVMDPLAQWLRPADPQIIERLSKFVGSAANQDAIRKSLLDRLRASDGDAQAWNELGMLLEARGEFYGAVCCYTGALRVQPVFAEAEFNLVCVRQRLFGGNL